MKQILYLFLLGILTISCSDYSDRFSELNAEFDKLAAENAALEAQVAAMQGASAQSAQATAAKLAEFQGAVTGIVAALQNLGQASAATIAQVSAVIQAIADLSQLVASNSASIADIADQISSIQAMLDAINESLGINTVEVTDNGDEALDLIVSVPAGTTSLRLSGPWWGWDPSGGPVATDNGDGTFTFRLDPAPAENMEYLYSLDGVSYENLIDNAANAECTDRVDGGLINTDYANYANRIWVVGSGDQAETYDSCSIDTITN
jgi:DNA-binding FrmR family transcriptional regulator